MIRFQRILGPMSEVAGKFVRLDLPCIDPDARPHFSDVLDHVRPVQVLADGLRERPELCFRIQHSSGTAAHRCHHSAARRLRCHPCSDTAIAGIYGMNFENMPELGTEYGYFWVFGRDPACVLAALRPVQASGLGVADLVRGEPLSVTLRTGTEAFAPAIRVVAAASVRNNERGSPSARVRVRRTKGDRES